MPVPVRERLLTTPPAIIYFGWTPADATELVRQLSLSATPRIIQAQYAGILEYACSPSSLVPWGVPLFRIYEVDLLNDLRRAEEAAARIGAAPFVVAARDFPSPVARLWSLQALLPPTMPPAPATAAQPPSGATPPGEPLIRLPRTGGARSVKADATAPSPASPALRTKSVEQASRELAAADSRVRALTDLLEAARIDLHAAEATAAPLKDDVAARRRLADIGALARNDVKAAEERLAEAVAAVTAAEGRVDEVQTALAQAQSARDAVLGGAEAARREPPPVEPPATVAPVRPSRPVLEAWSPPERPATMVASPSGAAALGGFPSPMLTGTSPPAPPVPAPTMSFRLAPRGDVSGFALWPPLPLPPGSTDLAHPRWHDHLAPEQCLVARSFAPQGARVFRGIPIVEVRPARVARLRAEVAEPYTRLCRAGLPVQVAFPSQGSVFRGWVSKTEPTHSPRPPGASVEILLVESDGGGDAFAALEWMALSSAMLPAVPEPLTWNPPQPAQPAPTDFAALFPLGPEPDHRPRPAEMPTNAGLSGSLQLVGTQRPARFADSDPVARKKLHRLQNWRKSFVEGMKTTVFPQTGLALTYPREGEPAVAIERMAAGRVSHVPNMCAATLGQALGWCLGDAAMWAHRLPEKGYKVREDGVARPGDILVWPFTFGASRSQHVGIAVAQGGAMMVLSNSGGTLGTQPLSGGYLAFYRPKTATKMAALPRKAP